MTRAEVFADPAFVRLSEQQQAFVRDLVENGGDKVRAAHKAYKCKNDFTARTMANRCLRKLQIKRLADAYFGESLKDQIPSHDEMAAAAWDRFQSAPDDNAAHKWFTAAWNILKPKDEAVPPAPPASAGPKPVDDDVLKELERRGINGTSQ